MNKNVAKNKNIKKKQQGYDSIKKNPIIKRINITRWNDDDLKYQKKK
jgi:hypothetical protein